jgi:uncharacterized protein YndB with AHSA1/START domain
MDPLTHRLDRTVDIAAPREAVFRFFTDSTRWASWWGVGSTIEAKRGGKVHIRNPGGVEAVGEVLELHPPERIVFTYGFASGQPIPAGSSRATIRLESHGVGTRLHLTHEFPEHAAAVRDEHIQGWRFQLSLFGNVVTNDLHKDAASRVDQWFDAWAEPKAEVREETLSAIAAGDVTFRDQFSLLNGLADLFPHIAAAQRFMPGMRLERVGNVRHCQGMVLADWVAKAATGEERGRGTNVFTFGADQRIHAVTGFWGQGQR